MSPKPDADNVRVVHCRRLPSTFQKQSPWAILFLLLPELASAALPRFSNVFQDHMVLQRGYPVQIWGLGATQDKELIVEFLDENASVLASAKVRPWFDGKWNLTVPTLPEEATGRSLTLTVKNEDSVRPDQALQDVTMGDVYLFTGQSNVDLPESYALQFNETHQIYEEAFADEAGRRGMIRIMIVPNQVPGLQYGALPKEELANVPDCPLCPFPFSGHPASYHVCHCNALRWMRASAKAIRGFTALGWFSGAALARSVPALRNVPLGLVRSSWGGTKILRWSGPDAMAQCPQTSKPHGRGLPSDLFSNMIYPLMRLRFSAIVWMHGASDTGKVDAYLGPNYYACALPAMIRDWRLKFAQGELPFVVVELPAYCNERDWATFHTFCDQPQSILSSREYHLPAMRIAQAAAERLPEVYMVTTMDLGSMHPMGGSIHSDRKEELGKRVALAAQAAVYNDSNAIWEAPRANRASMEGTHRIRVEFALRDGERLLLNSSMKCPSQILGIYCTGAGFEVHSPTTLAWVPAASSALVGTSVIITAPANVSVIDRVRYAYADWPVCSLRSAASGLPARIFDLQVGSALLERSPEDTGKGSTWPWKKFTWNNPETWIPSGVQVKEMEHVQEKKIQHSVEKLEHNVEEEVKDDDGFEGFSWQFLIACSASLFTLVVCIQFCCLRDCRCCRGGSRREVDADQMQDQALLNKDRSPEYRGLKTISP